MKIVTTSATALMAIGMVAGASVGASACEWMKSAAATPVPQEIAAPATDVDPVRLAELGSAIVPRAPEETEAE